MEKSLLWEAFSSLSNAELREFDKFVRSPFFNTRPQLVALCEYLIACKTKGELPEFKGASVEQRLNNSALLGLLEKYFIQLEKSREEATNEIFLAAAYRKRKLGKHFHIALRDARKELESQPWRHTEYFQQHYLAHWEQYQFDTSEHRTESLNIQPTSDFLDATFLSRKLRLACLAVSHQAVFKTEYRLGLLPEILEYVASGTTADIPAVGLYYYCYHFLTDPFETGEGHFNKFREILKANSGSFPPEELRALYLLAINFGIKKLNELREGWLHITLDLYKNALDLNLLLENNQISRFAFNNIVAIALRVEELDWAEQFILQLKPKLERQWREATASLNLARVAYARKDYKTALLNLQRSDYKDLINNLIAKTLQLKIYYETEEFDLLGSHLASMKNFIRRHTAIGYHRSNYSHVVRFTQQLLKLNFNNPKAVADFRKKIEAEQVLSEKEWFLEMLQTAA